MERTLAWALAGDTLALTLVVLAAFGSGSLTMLAEMLRGLPLLAVEAWALTMMRAGHRGRLDHYAFGIGKMEQFVWLLIALVRLLAALFVVGRVAEAVLVAQVGASPLGLALAAVVNAVLLLVNGTAMVALTRAAGEDREGAIGAQLAVRKGMLIAAIILQGCLTVAALTRDPDFALALDAAGGLLVAFLMARGGVRMLARCLPDLLDGPPPAALGEDVRRIAGTVFSPAELVSVRLRRSSRATFAQIVVDPAAFADSATLDRRVAAMDAALHAHGETLDVAILLAPATSARAPGEGAFTA